MTRRQRGGAALAVGLGLAASVAVAPIASAGGAPTDRLDALRPSLTWADDDRGGAARQGCLLEFSQTRSPTCVFGSRRSSFSVVLLGDSHSNQWFPALYPIARERGWRLTVLSKSSCTPAAIRVFNSRLRRSYRECHTWRRSALQRIARERPDLVVIGSATSYRVIEDGAVRGRSRSARALEDGLVTTMRRLRGVGSRVLIFRDPPRPPEHPAQCLRRHPADFSACAFGRNVGYRFARVNARAALRVAGVQSIDTQRLFCSRRCPVVVGNVLVYRDPLHLTATYAKTQTDWLRRRLPQTRGRATAARAAGPAVSHPPDNPQLAARQ